MGEHGVKTAGTGTMGGPENKIYPPREGTGATGNCKWQPPGRPHNGVSECPGAAVTSHPTQCLQATEIYFITVSEARSRANG